MWHLILVVASIKAILFLFNFYLGIVFFFLSSFFLLFYSEDYPQSRPRITILSSMSQWHPYINTTGLFQLPKQDSKEREVLTVIEILQAILDSFLDSKVLTNAIDF